jgi:hypothetical protein
MTSSTHNRFTKVLVLGAIVAAAAAPVAGATGHPAGTRNAAVPDVLERYAAAHPFGTDALKWTQATDRIVDDYFRDPSHPNRTAVSSPQQGGIPFYTPKMFAAHLNREDRLYQPRSPVSAVQAGIPFYTPKMLATHFNREDRLYQPPSPVSAASETLVSDGFNWSDWAIGLGTGLGMALIFGGGLLMGRHLRHRGIQTA